MSDRELLALAAKAAGYEWTGYFGDDEVECQYFDIGLGEEVVPWNPLTDDGDALRLAVECEIAINPWAGKTVCWHEDSKVINHEKHDCNDNPCAATRRAITRAAAEIGRNMP